jgi:hypothetical protein
MRNIDDYLEQVDMIELYITKNIIKILENLEELDFIKENIFLLGANNKNRKNSLRILLDNQEFKLVKSLIESNPEILNFKNTNGTNLFQMIITINYFYDLIIQLIQILDEQDKNFLIKVITNTDNNSVNSIDLLLSIITSNLDLINGLEKSTDSSNLTDSTDVSNLDTNIIESFDKILKILKSIYLLDQEDKTLLITKLCFHIKNEKLLLKILKYIEPENIDIYPDEHKFTCIDYLFINDNINALFYLIPRINYIYFINTDVNFLFLFIERIGEISIEKSIKLDKLIQLVFDILSKSNIKKIKNIHNENLLMVLLKKNIIGKSDAKKYLKYFNVSEQSNDGESVSSILHIKSDLPNFKSLDIELDKLLEQTDIGIFNSDIEHNMLYTLIMLNKYKNMIIPYFVEDKSYKHTNSVLIKISNNDSHVISFLKNYFYRFNTFLPFIIIWKSLNNYYLDPNLLFFIKNNLDKDFIYIRLSISITNEYGESIRHANILLLDNKRKIIERFEPYGDISFYNSQELNFMIEQNITKPIGYKYKFVQPYPGFQLRSDEFERKNKVYGDPNGYCLAWCLLYLEIKLLFSQKNITINPIQYINWYIINQFDKDFKSIKKDTQTNKYMTFIRFYAKKLDTRKNKLLEKIDIEPNILYRTEIPKNESIEINKIINKELYDNLNIK